MRGYRGSVSQAVHHSSRIHRMASHQIAVQSQQRQRTARAAYWGIADIVVCMLSDALVLQLGVSTSARSVVLSRVSQRHILAQRAIARSGDAQLAADRVHEAFADLRFQRLPQRRANTFELVGYVGSAKQWLLIAVKLVPGSRAKTGVDEWWISTVHPFGQKAFHRLQSSGRLAVLGSTV